MERNIIKIFGKNIKRLRNILGLTQAQVAEKLGIEEMSVSRIETGARFTRIENIEKLVDILQCQPSDLFAYEQEKTEAELKKEIRSKIAKAKLKDLKYYNKMIDAYLEAKN